MPELGAFQRWFADSLIVDPTNPELAALPGFAVYRNTSLSAAIDALAANYPRIEALLGAAAFAGIALDYARTYRPDTPVMATYGASFPTYLAGHPIRAELPYLADVARIDRLWTEAFFAPDVEPLSAETFSTIDLAENAAYVQSLHPASRHAWFEGPAAAIWLAHQTDLVEPFDVAWQPGGIHLTRGDAFVTADAVPWADILFLDLLVSGLPLVECAERTLTACPDADLASIVARLLSKGALQTPVS